MGMCVHLSVIWDLKRSVAYLPFTRTDCRVNEIALRKRGILIGMAIT